MVLSKYISKNLVWWWWTFKKNGNAKVKVKQHGIIKVHFQKTWYYYGENAKKHDNTNVKVKKWPYRDTSANTMVL